MVVLIVSIGAYYGYRNRKKAMDVAAPLLDRASRIIAGGFFPLFIAARFQNEHDFPDTFLGSFRKELKALENDARFPLRVWSCYRLMRRLSIIEDLGARIAKAILEAGVSEEALHRPLTHPLWVELYRLDTGAVYVQAVRSLYDSITVSMLHPGIAVSQEGVFNTMYLTPFPCLSLLEESGQTVTFLSQSYVYGYTKPIVRYLKTLQFIRSEDLCRKAVDRISEKNTVTEIDLQTGSSPGFYRK
ncbi:MAG TPA: hypothetical protein PLU68_10135 [Thermotogota bacterium]|nr:hypothetical protein [Thermotogota bacterium]